MVQLWELKIVTGESNHAGTESEIYVQLITADGESPVIRCHDNSETAFQMGETDQFLFGLKTPLYSPVTMIHVWHDNSGNNWQPASFQLFDNQCRQYNFPVPAETVIEPDRIHTFTPADVERTAYHVEIKTGESWGAGTDAKVQLNIIGSKGRTRFRYLNTAGENDFESGVVDRFTVKCGDIGEIEALQVMLVPNGTLGASWQCDTITVSSDACEPAKFVVKRTLSPSAEEMIVVSQRGLDDDEEDEQGEVGVPEQRDDQLALTVKSKFRGHIYTEDEFGAGTNANIYITLTDIHGESVGPYMIKQNRGDNERGGVMPITIGLVEKLTTLEKISVRQDGEGFGSDWKLDKIELTPIDPITHEEIGDVQTFQFDQWIRENEEYEILHMSYE